MHATGLDKPDKTWRVLGSQTAIRASSLPTTFTRGGITLYSGEPIPREPAGRILEEVERRLARSPLAALTPRGPHGYVQNRNKGAMA